MAVSLAMSVIVCIIAVVMMTASVQDTGSEPDTDEIKLIKSYIGQNATVTASDMNAQGLIYYTIELDNENYSMCVGRDGGYVTKSHCVVYGSDSSVHGSSYDVLLNLLRKWPF